MAGGPGVVRWRSGRTKALPRVNEADGAGSPGVTGLWPPSSRTLGFPLRSAADPRGTVWGPSGVRGEGEGEHRSGDIAGVVPSREVTALGAGEVAGNGELETCAAASPRAGLLRAVEALEDAREVFRGDAGARIRDGGLGHAVQRPSRDRYGTALGRVSHGVVKEGGEYLARARRVAAYGEFSWERDLESDLLGRRTLEEPLGGLARDDREVKGLPLDLKPAGVEARAGAGPRAGRPCG